MVEDHEGNGQLVLQLKEALPGFHALDRGLIVDGVRVELVGKDGDGRLLFVREVERVDDGVLTELLDLVALARGQTSLLARHLGADRDAEPPLVVLVAGEVDPRAARRLTAFERDAVRVLESRTIQSDRAASTFLVPHGPAEAPPGLRAVEERLGELERSVRRRVDVLIDRLGRVDEELSLATTEDGLEWRWRGRPIAAIHVDGSAVRGGVVGADHRPLADDETMETLVDQAIARWLNVTEEAEGLGALDGPPTPRPLVGRDDPRLG